MKALIIDDHPVFISALESILKGMRRSLGVDTAITAEAALNLIDHYPDYQLILLDLSMPGLDGIAFLRALAQRRVNTPVIIVSSCEDPDTIHACIKAGALGYIPKSHNTQQMAEAIKVIQQGEIYLPNELLHNQPHVDPDMAAIKQRCEQIGITTKTYEVLSCLAKGKTNKEIAQTLHISVHTVKAHLAKLFDRLQTGNRMDTVVEAIRLGLIDDERSPRL